MTGQRPDCTLGHSDPQGISLDHVPVPSSLSLPPNKQQNSSLKSKGLPVFSSGPTWTAELWGAFGKR